MRRKEELKDVRDRKKIEEKVRGERGRHSQGEGEEGEGEVREGQKVGKGKKRREEVSACNYGQPMCSLPSPTFSSTVIDVFN